MKVNDKFSSFEELECRLKLYETTMHSNFFKRDSRTLQSQRASFPKGRCSQANMDLKYYYIKYQCIKGGKMTPKNQVRKTFTLRQGCSASLHFTLSSCGQFLLLKELNEEHNHDLSEEGFKTLPNQRCEFKRRINLRDVVDLKSNKKPRVQKSRPTDGTDSSVTLKDLTNLSGLPNSEMGLAQCMILLRETYKCFVDILYDSDGNVAAIFFQDPGMSKSFQTYPEVLFVDGTHRIQESRSSIYLLVVEDAEGKSCVAAVGILVYDDALTMDWLFTVFARENEECFKTKVILTDKDSKERDSLRKLFPKASLKIGLSYTLRRFKKEISQKHMDISNDECVSSKETLLKLANAQSETEFGELYNKLINNAPDAVISYFNENWMDIKEEWTMYSNISSRSFVNKTNSKVEHLFKNLKTVIARFSNLQEFIKNFFVVLYTYRTSKNIRSSRDLHKVSTAASELNSPSFHYGQLLTNFAYEKVEKELSEFSKIEIMPCIGGQQYFSPSAEGLVSVQPDSCQCQFWNLISLPCRHIFKLRDTLNVPLYDESLCLERWTKKHYFSNNEFVNPEEEGTAFQDGFQDADEKRTLTSHEKFKKMNDVGLKLSKLCSTVPSHIFYRRLEVIKGLNRKWSAMDAENKLSDGSDTVSDTGDDSVHINGEMEDDGSDAMDTKPMSSDSCFHDYIETIVEASYEVCEVEDGQEI